jgi:hypothetical protein
MYLVGLESSSFKLYALEKDNMLVIDSSKHPGNSVTSTIKATIDRKKPPVEVNQVVTFNKMATWNERADIGAFTFNQVSAFPSGWYPITIGGESLQGNGASVEVEIAGMDKAKIQTLNADLHKLKLTFTTDKDIPDGFIALNRVNSSFRQIFVAYKHKSATFTKNKMWFFNCDFDKKECIEFGKGGTFPDNYRMTNNGYSNDKLILLFMKLEAVDGLEGLFFSLSNATDKEVSPESYQYSVVKGAQVTKVEFYSNNFTIFLKKQSHDYINNVVYKNIIDDELSFKKIYSSLDNNNLKGSTNYRFDFQEYSYDSYLDSPFLLEDKYKKIIDRTNYTQDTPGINRLR